MSDDTRGSDRSAPAATPFPGALTVGRVRGVPIAVHWSVAVVMGIVAWGLATSVLPVAYPGRPRWSYAVAGVAAALVFLGGLLAHELSHAVVARRNGVRVDSITLWMFGGVAQLQGEADTPGAELRIAGVGPLVSLLLGLAFGALAFAAAAADAPGLLVGALTWLAGINLLLAVFNVLPGAPLDGGRLLRAVLWRWRGDRQWAAVTAARAGRGLGVVLIVVGFVEIVRGVGLSGVWLALIGWFLFGAASAEGRSAQISGSVAGLSVGDVMTPMPDTVPPDLSVALFVDRYLLAHRHSAFPVVKDDVPVGLVSLSRVRTVPPERRAWTSVQEIAWPMSELATATPDEPLGDLLRRLDRRTGGRALVLSDGRLVGIVTSVDVSRAVERATLLRQTTAPGAPAR
jgi:Zn-dependent protease/predicted transcriptional regulator